MNNLAGVSSADLKIIKGTHDAAEDAEVQAFNPAIAAASGDADTALQVSFPYIATERKTNMFNRTAR